MDKKMKYILACLIVVLLVCIIPFPKKIDGTFPTIDQDGKDTVVTVKGTYYDYLIRKDQFDGVLIDETGVEYPSVEKSNVISETSVNDKVALPINFVYDDGKKVLFATAWFETDLTGIIYCVFMD